MDFIVFLFSFFKRFFGKYFKMFIIVYFLLILDLFLDLIFFDFLFSVFVMFCGDLYWEEECKRNESFLFFGILYIFFYSVFMNLYIVRGFLEVFEMVSLRNCLLNVMIVIFKFLEL